MKATQKQNNKTNKTKMK